MVDDDGVPITFDSATDYMEKDYPAGGKSSDTALVEYLIFPEAFKNEVCKGLDPHFVAKMLKDAEALKHEAGRETIRHRLPGMGKAPVFHILPTVFAEGE